METNGIEMIHEGAFLQAADTPDGATGSEDFALAPLVEKIAHSIARGLVVAMKELEHHIASETRKVGDTVDRRLDIIQTSLQVFSSFVTEQQATNAAVEGQLQKLTAGLQETGARQAAETEAVRREAQEFSTAITQRMDETAASLREADARQAADLAKLQEQTQTLSEALSERIDALCKDLGVQQEDLGAIKETLRSFSTRVEALVNRLDRQADAVRSIYAAYSQRETELEQVVDGLTRLRAFPTPLPSNGL